MNYYIAFSGRVGSSMLCDMLLRTGKLGDPKEYFAVDLPLPPELKGADTKACVAHVLARNASPNGASGMKLSIEQMQHLENVTGGKLPEPDYWILMRRRDKLRQAISSYKCLKTQRCHFPTNEKVSPDPEFDPEAILQIARSLVAEDCLWVGFLGARPRLDLWYEDWIGQPARTVEQVASFLGVGPVTVQPSDHQRMANETSERWYQELLPRWREAAV